MYIKFDPEETGFWYCENMDSFLARYPRHIHGRYMPQPRRDPDKFPVWIHDDGLITYVDNGPDEHRLFYLYADQVTEIADPVDLSEIIKVA